VAPAHPPVSKVPTRRGIGERGAATDGRRAGRLFTENFGRPLAPPVPLARCDVRHPFGRGVPRPQPSGEGEKIKAFRTGGHAWEGSVQWAGTVSPHGGPRRGLVALLLKGWEPSFPDSTMPAHPPRRRRFVRIAITLLGVVGACVLLVLLLHPWVVAWSARLATPVAGFDFETAEVEGFHGLVLGGVRYDGPVRLRADTVRLPLPWGWWRAEAGDAVVQVREWELGPGERSGETEEANPASSPRDVLRQLSGVFARLEDHLPGAVLTEGRLTFTAEAVELERIVWDGRIWTAEGSASGNDFAARLERLGEGVFGAGFEIADRATGEARVAPAEAAEEVEAQVTLRALGGRVQGLARVGPGWLPGPVQLRVGEALQLPLHPELAVEVGEGGLRIEEEGERWVAALNGSGVLLWTPREGTAPAPAPWSIDLSGARTEADWELASARLELPFLSAALDAPVRLDRATLAPEETARWQLDFDASAFPLGGWAGSGALEVDLTRTRLEGRGPALGLAARGTVSNWRGESSPPLELDLRARLRPDFGLFDTLSLSTGEGSELIASGALDRTRETWSDGQLALGLEGSELEALIPGLTSAGGARLEGTFRGPLASPEFVLQGHSKELELGDHGPLSVSFTAQGEGAERGALEATVERGPQTVAIAVRLDLGSPENRTLHLDTFEIALEGEGGAERVLRLQSPVTLVQRTTDDPPVTWSAFQLAEVGGGSGLELEPGGWTLAGRDRLALLLRQVDPAWVAPWVSRDLPDVRLGRLAITAEGNDASPWLDFAIEAEGAYRAEDFEIPFRLRAQGDEEGLSWDRSILGELVETRGVLPVLLGWEEGSPRWDLSSDDPLEIDLAVEGIDALPPWVSSVAGIEFSGLTARLRLEGTLSAPSGQFALEARSLGLDTPGEARLVLEDLVLGARADPSAFVLDEGSFRVPGIERRARLRAEVRNLPWREVLDEPDLALMEKAEGSISIEGFPLLPVADLFPTTLERSGILELDIAFRSAGQLSGEARVRDAALQPWPNGSVLQAIRADLVFDGRRIEIATLAAELSGKPVTAGGFVDLTTWNEPTYRLEVKAEELDLLRRDNLILRSGLDLSLRREEDASALLSGTIELRNSLWLQDLTDFAARGPAGAGGARPPYFRVSAEPFAGWRLALRVTGERFLNLQSTFLTGEATADFDLEGTLGDPLLTGQVTLAEGATLRFPFGSLGMERTRATITADRPHDLQLSAVAGGNAYGYQITLRIDGTASDPELELTSIPPLDQEEVLLLLTTGRQPRDEGGEGFAERGGRLAYYVGQDIFSKTLGGGRTSNLRIHSGDTLSQFGQETTAVEYRVNEEFSIIGEYDEFDDYNLNVRWRFLRDDDGKDKEEKSE
jgi:translocation and assembly module TamB